MMIIRRRAKARPARACPKVRVWIVLWSFAQEHFEPLEAFCPTCFVERVAFFGCELALGEADAGVPTLILERSVRAL
jgi:hypothetical protein